MVPDAKIDAARQAGAAGAEATRGREDEGQRGKARSPPTGGEEAGHGADATCHTAGGGKARARTKWRPRGGCPPFFLPSFLAMQLNMRAEDEPLAALVEALMYGNMGNANYAVHGTPQATRRWQAGHFAANVVSPNFNFTTVNIQTREVYRINETDTQMASKQVRHSGHNCAIAT